MDSEAPANKMLSEKQQRMLELLDEQMSHCIMCSIYKNRCSTYWTSFSEYGIIGEAPGEKEVKANEPFYGPAGSHLWNIMDEFGLRKEQFAIINSINCRPMDGNRNGKPTKQQQVNCYSWLRKFFRVVRPQKILLLGNYAMQSIFNVSSGIMNMNGTTSQYTLVNESVPVILSVHPSMCIYKGEEGKKMLRESISKFKEWR